MLYEYAVEPEVLGTWSEFRYFLEQFGIGQGRLIANYPKGWGQMVWEACLESDPVKRKRIELRLGELRRKTAATRRAYTDGEPWLTNALAAHQQEPFHAIVVKSECAHPHALRAEELDATTPLWKVETDGCIQRTALTMAALAGPLLRHSSEIRFVDQHYSPTVKHGKPLAAFIAEARRGKVLVSMEYHLNANGSADHFCSELDRRRQHLHLLAGEKIVFVRWRCIDDGENQHPRYILTNRGGLRYDYGLDEGNGTTDWSRLSEDLWRQRLQQYRPDAGVFELVDAWQVTGTGVLPMVWRGTRWEPAS